MIREPGGSSESRALWDADVQSAELEVAALLEQEWRRVWDEDVAFFAERYESHGLSRDDTPQLEDIPTTTKAMLRQDEAAHPRFGRHRTVGAERAARVSATTGTTGEPWLIFYTARDLETMVGLQYQHTWRVGMRPGHHFAHSWPGGLYPTAVLGGRHLLDLGILEIPVGPPFSAEQAAGHVRLWRDLGVDALMCTGSQLVTYDEAAAGLGVDLAEVLAGARLVIVEASCQFAGPRQRLEAAYQVRIHNISGAGEVLGFVTSDCEHHTGLHIPSGHHTIQVCDPATGRELPDGERGTLVVSVFGLDFLCLRYDLEDLAVAHHDPCPCGQTGPRYTLLGRAADAAFVGGSTVLPLDVQLVLERFGAPEFVLRPGRHEALHLRVESPKDREIAEQVRSELQVACEVESVAPGTLPRAAFKPRRIAQ